MATKSQIRAYAQANNCSREEAKQHFANQANQTTTTLRILAIRHCKDGVNEFASYAIDVNENHKRDKSRLLEAICCNDWLHTPPVQPIADYLVKTNAYNTLKMFSQDFYGWTINFHEVDEQLSAMRGEKVYSCRIIHPVDKEEWDKLNDDIRKTYSEDPSLSLQTGKHETVDYHI